MVNGAQRTVRRAAARRTLGTGLLWLIAMATPVHAQEVRRGFIGLDIGPSQPIGAFARESNAPGAGNARAGYTSTLVNIGWRRTERWGVAGFLAYSEYFMHNTDGIDDDWWQVAFVTAGPMYTIPLSAKAALDLKGTLGLAALTPVFDSFASSGGTGAGLAIDVRATLRYDILHRWAVFAEAGMQSANVSFSDGGRQQYRALIGGFGIAFRPQW